MAKTITLVELKKENAKLKRMLALTANKLHETLNSMQPFVADSKDDAFIRAYELGRNHVRRNFNIGTELKKKTKKGKKLSEDELYFEALPPGDNAVKLFQMMRGTYTQWHIEAMNNNKMDLSQLTEIPPELKPVWEGRQFGDLKKLETHFLKIAVYRAKKHHEETAEVITQEMVKDAANLAWGNLLNGVNSDRVTPYIKSQKKISQILYNLTNIIDQLKNGNGKGNARNRQPGIDEVEREIALASGMGNGSNNFSRPHN